MHENTQIQKIIIDGKKECKIDQNKDGIAIILFLLVDYQKKNLNIKITLKLIQKKIQKFKIFKKKQMKLMF